MAGLTLWEAAILPSLLYNSECWVQISKSTLQQLESLQLQFYRVLLSVGTGCPIPALYWDTGALLMKYRILKRKLSLLHHIATLPSNTLANEMYEIQSQLQLPGLLQECNEFLINTGVVDIKIFTKKQWKTFINRKISEQNEKEILTMMNSYKKIDAEDYKNESCKIQPYLKALNSKDARLRFKLRAKMTPTVKMNFMSDSTFSENLGLVMVALKQTFLIGVEIHKVIS